MKKLYIFFIFLGIAVAGNCAVEIPKGFNRNMLVNDLGNVMSDAQEQQLNQKLNNFARTTSTQILVLTLDKLDDDPSLYASELGHELGVGQDKQDNGIVVLVKKKTAESGGKVAISNGYGIEYLVTDALAKRIIENEMIPAFRMNDYYAGIDNAVNVLIELTKGEYTADNYVQQTQSSSNGGFPGFFIFFIIVIVILKMISAASGARRLRNTSMGRSNMPFFLLMLMSMNSGSRHRGSWNSFNSGSGSFGGFSGGGFGGFGGGGFGGGGASGSW